MAGDANNGFGVGDAEAHAGGISKSVTKTVSTNVESNVESNVGTTVDVEAPVVVDTSELQTQTQIKPQSIYTETQSVTIQSTTSNVQTPQSEQTTQTILQTTHSSSLAPETTVNNPSMIAHICFCLCF